MMRPSVCTLLRQGTATAATTAASGDLDAAIEDYTAAIALYEDVADKAKAYANRSLARSSQGDHAGAAADFTEARRLNPDLTPPPDPSPVNPNLPDSD